jgi:AcrR family transcriptional regulator
VAAKKTDREAGGGQELGPLPSGHHGLSREQVAESQHERLLAAVVELVAAQGYHAATITAIAKAAKVSMRVFYANFPGKEECFLAAFDAVADHLGERLAAAARAEAGWPEGVVAALRQALDFFAAEPGLARFCLVEPIGATVATAARLREALLAAVPCLRAGRALRPAGAEELADSTEDSVLGGLLATVSRAVLAGEAASLPGLLPRLVEFALAPYVGPDEARRLAAASVS